MAQLAAISQNTLPIAHSMAQLHGASVTVPSDPVRNRSSSHQRADTKHESPERGEDKRYNRSRPPERDEVEKDETPTRHASQPPARRIRGKSKGELPRVYVETQGASSSGDTQVAEEPRGRSTTAAPFGRDFRNLAISTITKQQSIVNLRKLLTERGVVTEDYHTKERLATMLQAYDKRVWSNIMHDPLPKAAAKSSKKQAEAALKAAGVKGLK